MSAPFFNKVYSALKVLEPELVETGNFRYIYDRRAYRKEFYNFLVNVFHLYPEDKIHQHITLIALKEKTDEAIYRKLQEDIDWFKPFLADLRYALPALAKQKNVIASQTVKLLGKDKFIQGYLEVGSNGRYIDALEHELDINGDIFFLNSKPATFSPVDMIDRGQIIKAGIDIQLNNYDSSLATYIPNKSIDLATVYIGFHHCPNHLREEFITSIRDALTDKGSLILRDHNAHDKKMWHMVALAHDVFNMGTMESWQVNQDELRLFYSHQQLDSMLQKYGFKTDGRKLYQQGDPTLNALMLYTKA